RPAVCSGAPRVRALVALWRFKAQAPAMHVTRIFPPPAGIDPLVVVTNNMSWGFLLAPVAVGAVLLALFAFLWHNLPDEVLGPCAGGRSVNRRQVPIPARRLDTGRPRAPAPGCGDETQRAWNDGRSTR